MAGHSPGQGGELVTSVRVGDVLAEKYRVDRILGTGGMGVVVAAHHLQLEDILFGSKTIFSGQLDEVRVWNVARTAAQISSTYQVGVSPSSAGLVAYWNLNEAPGTQTVTDSTTGAHDGTLGANSSVATDDPTRVAR
jgi:hypothetical protein